MRVVWRLFKVSLLLFALVTHASVARVFIRNEAARRRFASRNLSRYSRVFLKILRMRCTLVGIERLEGDPRHFLIIANHLSYLDVMIIAAQLPALFVTSVEIENTPVLGTLCRAGGSYFVERRNRTRLAQELDSLGQVLSEGVSLVIFPEGTTSNGDSVLPFKKSLFASAVKAGTPVLPLCIRYLRADGKPVDAISRDSLYYYGDMTFFAHFWRFIRLRSIDIELVVLDPLDVSSESCRKELASLSHERISQAFAVKF